MYSDPSLPASSSSSVAMPVTMPTYPNLTARACTRYDITVTDPERKGEGISQYVCYKVSSLLEYDNSDGRGEPSIQSCVIRRFSDFVWLHESLEAELKGLLIPALPDKALMGRFQPEFVEERRRALQLFLHRLMEHPIIRQHAHVLLFLTGTDTALQHARALTGGEQGIKQTTTKMGNSFLSYFTSTVALVTNTIAPGKEHPKTEDDIACEKIQEYAVALQQELTALETQVEAWLAKEKALGRAWSDMGMSVAMVAQAEGQGRATNSNHTHGIMAGPSSAANSVDYHPPAAAAAAASSSLSASSVPPSSSSAYTSFSDASLGLGGDPELSRLLSLLGQSSDRLAMLTARKEIEESLEFREPLKDAQRTASAVEAMLKRRAACLAEYHALVDAADAARAKLVSAQATQGREGKLPSLETALAAAEREAASKQFELAQMTVAVRAEFARSQTEKSAALAQIVRTFIRLQVEHSKQIAGEWERALQCVNEAITPGGPTL